MPVDGVLGGVPLLFHVLFALPLGFFSTIIYSPGLKKAKQMQRDLIARRK